MRPTLIQIGPIGLPSYGVMLLISFVVGLFLVKRSAKRYGISPAFVENLAFWIMVGVIVGGRLLYVFFHWSDFESDILVIFKIWTGGMMFFGSFIGALVAGLLYVRKQKVSPLLLSDLISPSFGLGEFFTRIGCFLNGCCFGIPSALFWSVKFPFGSLPARAYSCDTALHPTQLYSSLFGLLLFFFLQKRLGEKHYRGELFAIYLVVSGLFRFGIDFIRHYENAANLLVNQFISGATVIAGIIMLVLVYKKKTADKRIV
ncbi:MAG TPA: prolipoprotein diacylglyceryl transferase [bacterium]